jgi:hypothetical protein
MQRLTYWLDAHVQCGFGHINADKLLHYRFVHGTHPCKNTGLFAQATVRVINEKPARRSLLSHGLDVPRANRAVEPGQTKLTTFNEFMSSKTKHTRVRVRAVELKTVLIQPTTPHPHPFSRLREKGVNSSIEIELELHIMHMLRRNFLFAPCLA